ncbi:hypothetical protein HDE_05003 [Halotydeus destructor]|nr:hypothetical protein HDE_05003 [Halotydeus destructor]
MDWDPNGVETFSAINNIFLQQLDEDDAIEIIETQARTSNLSFPSLSKPEIKPDGSTNVIPRDVKPNISYLKVETKAEFEAKETKPIFCHDYRSKWEPDLDEDVLPPGRRLAHDYRPSWEPELDNLSYRSADGFKNEDKPKFEEDQSKPIVKDQSEQVVVRISQVVDDISPKAFEDIPGLGSPPPAENLDVTYYGMESKNEVVVSERVASVQPQSIVVAVSDSLSYSVELSPEKSQTTPLRDRTDAELLPMLPPSSSRTDEKPESPSNETEETPEPLNFDETPELNKRLIRRIIRTEQFSHDGYEGLKNYAAKSRLITYSESSDDSFFTKVEKANRKFGEAYPELEFVADVQEKRKEPEVEHCSSNLVEESVVEPQRQQTSPCETAQTEPKLEKVSDFEKQANSRIESKSTNHSLQSKPLKRDISCLEAEDLISESISLLPGTEKLCEACLNCGKPSALSDEMDDSYCSEECCVLYCAKAYLKWKEDVQKRSANGKIIKAEKKT